MNKILGPAPSPGTHVQGVEMHRTRHKIGELSGWSNWSKWEEGFGKTDDPTFEIEIDNRIFYPVPDANPHETAVMVPKSALEWLFGEGPDANGEWFERPEGSAGHPYWWRTHLRKLLAASPSANPHQATVENGLADLIVAFYEREIGRLMHQAEHWAANGAPAAVMHRLHKADAYFQIVCKFRRGIEGFEVRPFDEIRKSLTQDQITQPGKYPPSADLHRYRDPEFVAAALATAPKNHTATSEEKSEAYHNWINQDGHTDTMQRRKAFFQGYEAGLSSIPTPNPRPEGDSE